MVHRCLPVSGEQSSEVPKRPLHSGHRRQQPTSTISQPAFSWLHRAVGGLHSAVGLSLWHTRRSGTHYRLSFVICLSVLVTLDAAWRRYCSHDISALSAIQMRCIILHYINFLFYSILWALHTDIREFVMCVTVKHSLNQSSRQWLGGRG